MNKRKYTCYLPRASSLLPHPGAYQSDAAAAAALVVVVYKRISFAVSFFSFFLYTFTVLKIRAFSISRFGDTFKGWKPTEKHFTCVSPRLPLPPSSFSPRLSLSDDDGRSSAFCPSFFEGRRVDTSRIDEDTTRFDRLIKISAASDLRYFY